MHHQESPQALARKLQEGAALVTVGGSYRHYKHLDYVVLRLALREEDNEVCVVYQAMYDQSLLD